MEVKKEKIFISHSSKDLIFVESFVENILRLGLNIPAERIFCTSMEGHGVSSGEYIPDRLREEIHVASIVLLFISKNYKSSEVCLNEVGAAWVSLEKKNIIPLLLPDIDFNELGFLDLGRLGIKIYEQGGLLKLIQDNKVQLNPHFNLAQLHKQIEVFLKKTKQLPNPIDSEILKTPPEEVNEWDECFTNNLYPFDEIIRKTIPTNSDGIYEIKDNLTQNKILTELSNANFLRTLWYKHAEGDCYVEKLQKLPSGNWLISEFNWEVKISSIWVSKNVELQYEFILIHSDSQEPYKINSDIGGEGYNAGILNDGTIVSENERLNGYAIIDGKTIDLAEHGIQSLWREEEAHWVFFVTDYHKAGYNADETLEFCQQLDRGEIEVNRENIFKFLRPLRNEPTVIRWR